MEGYQCHLKMHVLMTKIESGKSDYVARIQ